MNVGEFARKENDFNFNISNATVDLSNWQLNPALQTMAFDAQFNAKDLPSGTYFIKIDLHTSSAPNNFDLTNYQSWWNGWNTEGGLQAGNKTYKLRYFLNDLQGVTLEVMKSKNSVIGRFCYVVQKN